MPGYDIFDVLEHKIRVLHEAALVLLRDPSTVNAGVMLVEVAEKALSRHVRGSANWYWRGKEFLKCVYKWFPEVHDLADCILEQEKLHAEEEAQRLAAEKAFAALKLSESSGEAEKKVDEKGVDNATFDYAKVMMENLEEERRSVVANPRRWLTEQEYNDLMNLLGD